VRGPFRNDKTGVTGENNFDRDKSENYETYTDDEGVVRTRLLPPAESRA
jgi:hypothetical protein